MRDAGERMPKNSPPRNDEGGVPGVISPGCLYTATEARKRLGMGAWAWRKLRRGGLPVIYVGGKSFVLGDDVIAFFRDAKTRA